MAVNVSIEHFTHYQYDRRIMLGSQTIRLRPAPHVRSPIHKYSFEVFPKKYFLNWQQDPFGNYLARLVFQEPVSEMKIKIGMVTEIRSFNPFDFFLDEVYDYFPFTYSEQVVSQLKPYLEKNECGPLLTQLVEMIPLKKARTIDFLVALNQHLYKKLKYLIRLAPGVQSCEETLSKKSGSCRDFAWLLCMVLRHLGLASRFVSGYLIQLKPDIKSPDGPNGPEEDFTDLHAWAEVYIPGAGWIGLDATSGLLAGEGHIPLCCTPSPVDAAPVTGSLDPCEATLDHKMSLKRLNQDRRITKPYTTKEWDKIVKAGHIVDKRLQESDVRLTLGGEPTFVPFDNIQSESWSGEALGDQKKQSAYELFMRLRNKFGPSGLVHIGQGKWYPGEELPRWSMSCFWRIDKEPVCNTHNSFPKEKPSEQILTIKEAKRLIGSLANHIAISDQYILPAYEDAVFAIWQERKNPMTGIAWDRQDLSKPDLRQKLGQEMAKNLAAPTGYVLPLLFSHTLKRWISSPWVFNGDELVLTPGNSSIGYRLPLTSLPYHQEGISEVWPERDPFTALNPLPTYVEIKQSVNARVKSEPIPERMLSNGYVRTALCVEVRAGQLFVFMPPVPYLEHYLELVCAIEMVAAQNNLDICFEGYRPPRDPRVMSYSITPDPGVIEVNIFPAKNWGEFLSTNEILYDEAHKSKLSTSRYFLDGRRVGTGGGNHIVLGAEKPVDSPFLRNPGLLRSLITFWQHHPSLSYLFASEFIGPTSQAPRIDEARNDSLYELEIAFNQITDEKTMPYWTVDRLFRNLLIDATGNTHRTEFCIDKLYSPESEAGRLGLLELRSFEMPPHPQMSAVQVLLVRAAIATFWNKPYTEKLIRWNTRLHDEFMLPYYLWNDLLDVLERLSDNELKWDAKWFQSFLDFRCPIWGKTQIKHINIELRHALEPWHVMGEETYQGSVSRAVDSSVERIQLKVEGFDERYEVLCNKYPVPLRKVSEEGTYVAGIRYKAWKPPSGLHPTIPIHTPLIFDVVRKSDSYSLGGFTYHITHQGGRSYEQVPINENEAESRCRARFDITGHTPGEVEILTPKKNLDFPNTLDLRFV